MASQYNLELKGILDLKQVKQELEKLRSLQYSITGNNTSNRNNVGNTSTSNLNKLNSTLAKLTSTIAQLNTNIARLNGFNQKINSSNIANRSNLPIYPILSDNVKKYNLSATEILTTEKNGVSTRMRTLDYSSRHPI